MIQKLKLCWVLSTGALCLSSEMSYKQCFATPVNGFLTLLKEVGCLLKALVWVTVTKLFCSLAF